MVLFLFVFLVCSYCVHHCLLVVGCWLLVVVCCVVLVLGIRYFAFCVLRYVCLFCYDVCYPVCYIVCYVVCVVVCCVALFLLCSVILVFCC